jgi:hypothetical protein
MKKHLFKLSFDKRYSLIRKLFVILIFLFFSHIAQSTTYIYVYEVSPNISIETDKNKAEVLFVFEQTIIENGFIITRHKVVGENRYSYEITLNDGYYIDGELILFYELENDKYLLERVTFESGFPDIEESGDEIVSDLIVIPFKAKISD